MDIIKSILHVFKKSDNAFKVMHPETESACITDWNTGIVNTLASTGLSSLVNVLSSDSLLALLIKKVFDATGVRYSLGQNGYVCFGSLVGGQIIQWGKTANSVVVWPISFTNTDYTATGLKHADHGGGVPNIIGLDKNKITIELESMSYNNGIGTQNTYMSNGVYVIAIGY